MSDVIEKVKREVEKMKALNIDSVTMNNTTVEALIAEVEWLREKMAWLGKGKMRPLERQYQTYLQHDQDEDYDDTPPDYVEWLEQIAEGDAVRPDGT